MYDSKNNYTIKKCKGFLKKTLSFGLEKVNLSGYSPNTDHVTLKSAARGAENWIPCSRWDSPMACIEHYRSPNSTKNKMNPYLTK